MALGSEDFPVDFLALVMEPDFNFFSGGADTEGCDLGVSCWPTTPMTETVAGSTSSSEVLVGVALSAFLASRFSFLSLYDGVKI